MSVCVWASWRKGVKGLELLRCIREQQQLNVTHHHIQPNNSPPLTHSSSAANFSSYYYHPPGVSAAAAATARTLYGDVEQYDEPTPSIMVHAHHNGGQVVSSPSPLPPPEKDDADGVGGGGGQQAQGQGDSPGAYAGLGGPLTLSSGGQASAFSSYVTATTSTTD